MILERKIYQLALLLLVLYILYHQSCVDKPCSGQDPVYQTRTDTIYQPVIEYVPEYAPKPARIMADTTIYVFDSLYVVEPVDTAAILQDYFAKVAYRDTVRIREGWITIQDTISKNRITSRRVDAALMQRTITATQTVIAKPRLQLYAGVSLLGNKTNPLHGFGGQLTVKTKSDQLYHVGGMLIGEQLYYSAGIHFKIRLK